ncbi:MAG: hypothetical protein HPY66_2325 [Firmicutes bacterium]|nr:hypothetical protein [Bacillota bacterium]MDI6705714.1 hypothetical protein [Bacillota bacterium]
MKIRLMQKCFDKYKPIDALSEKIPRIAADLHLTQEDVRKMRLPSRQIYWLLTQRLKLRGQGIPARALLR